MAVQRRVRGAQRKAGDLVRAAVEVSVVKKPVFAVTPLIASTPPRAYRSHCGVSKGDVRAINREDRVSVRDRDEGRMIRVVESFRLSAVAPPAVPLLAPKWSPVVLVPSQNPRENHDEEVASPEGHDHRGRAREAMSQHEIVVTRAWKCSGQHLRFDISATQKKALTLFCGAIDHVKFRRMPVESHELISASITVAGELCCSYPQQRFRRELDRAGVGCCHAS